MTTSRVSKSARSGPTGSCRSPPISVPIQRPLLLLFRRISLKQLHDSLVEVLNVFVGIIVDGIADRTAPEKLLVLGVRQLYHQRAHLENEGVIDGSIRSRVTPPPGRSKAIARARDALLIFNAVAVDHPQ